MALTPAQQADLLGLGWRWSEHYSLRLTDGGAWVARPNDEPGGAITASSAAELSEKLVLDYADRHPVTSDGHLHERAST